MGPPPATPSAPSAPAPGSSFSFVGVGAVGGALGTAIGGGLGGAFGGCIEAMAPPTLPAAVTGALMGSGLAACGGVVLGALIGLLVGRRRGRRAALYYTLLGGFLSALVAAVEASQSNLVNAAAVFVLGMASMIGLFVAVAWLWARRRVLRWFVLGWLVLCLIGEVYSRVYPVTYAPRPEAPAEPMVQLRGATLPSGLGVVAIHYWLLSFDPEEGRWHRWDLWQDADAGGTSWGHVHRDLLSPDSGVGGGPSRVFAEWRGAQAQRILTALARSPDYPYRRRYVAWPGPNSNTYIAWVLREAGVPTNLHPMALGRNYLGTVGAGISLTGTGVQAESSLLGLKAGLRDGIEGHFLCFTLGIDTWPPALKTPFGRVGFEE